MRVLPLMAVILVAAGPAIAQREFVAFENVDAEYRSLADVHPVVANRGRQTIYLWPQECREALVSWLESDGYWYDSDRKPCPDIKKPIELKPNETYRLPPLVIRIDLVDHFFEVRTAKPGKYKISMFYSFRPVYHKGPPQMRETVTREFAIVP